MKGDIRSLKTNYFCLLGLILFVLLKKINIYLLIIKQALGVTGMHFVLRLKCIYCKH